jgi:hypothetical protein
MFENVLCHVLYISDVRMCSTVIRVHHQQFGSTLICASTASIRHFHECHSFPTPFWSSKFVYWQETLVACACTVMSHSILLLHLLHNQLTLFTVSFDMTDMNRQTCTSHSLLLYIPLLCLPIEKMSHLCTWLVRDDLELLIHSSHAGNVTGCPNFDFMHLYSSSIVSWFVLSIPTPTVFGHLHVERVHQKMQFLFTGIVRCRLQ